MFRKLMMGALAVTACGTGNRENSAICGFTSMAGASMLLEQWVASKMLTEPPPELRGVVPARVVGHGTTRAVVTEGPAGPDVTYEGEGFPRIPGFGLVLVEDSADTFKGVLIYETDPPYGYTPLGTISQGSVTLPLYGLRVTWGAVSNERCPLFGPIDTTTAAGGSPSS